MTDKFTVRVVVLALAIAVLGGLAALAYLSFTGTVIPDQLDRLVTFLAGAMTSVLVRTSHDEPVSVTGPEGGPVETVDAGD